MPTNVRLNYNHRPFADISGIGEIIFMKVGSNNIRLTIAWVELGNSPVELSSTLNKS